MFNVLKSGPGILPHTVIATCYTGQKHVYVLSGFHVSKTGWADVPVTLATWPSKQRK